LASEKQPQVAIVILNWNGRKFLEQFLPSVLENSPGCRVIVADNASSDDSVAYLRDHFPQVEILRNSGNLGFCEGYNQALKQVEAKYYVLLNSDVQVTPNWTKPIISLLENDPEIAACQPKIKAFNEPSFLEYAGAAGGLIDNFGYPFCRGRLFDTLEKDIGQFNDTTEIFWATGACMFVRAEKFHQLGGLEPAFFAHMEEIDLCWRLKNAGNKIYYCGQSQVFHVGGGTLHKSNPRKTFLNFRNGLALLLKNLPEDSVFGTVAIRVLLDWVSALKFLLSGEIADAKAILKAHQEVFRQRHYWKHKRREQPNRKRLSEMPGVFNGSIVWEYFARGKKTWKDL
jgi:GT2 family glycosyltransferase